VEEEVCTQSYTQKQIGDFILGGSSAAESRMVTRVAKDSSHARNYSMGLMAMLHQLSSTTRSTLGLFIADLKNVERTPPVG
jgi:hypothetical protein